jgi:Flp pilus assembly pilin Flp
MRELWNNFVADESGQGLTEYILIIAAVAIFLIGVLVIFRDRIGDLFQDASDQLIDPVGGEAPPD